MVSFVMLRLLPTDPETAASACCRSTHNAEPGTSRRRFLNEASPVSHSRSSVPGSPGPGTVLDTLLVRLRSLIQDVLLLEGNSANREGWLCAEHVVVYLRADMCHRR